MPWNPRRRKKITREQAELKQAKAVQFVTDVVGDPDLADEIERLTVEQYAERKGFELSNPSGRGVIHMKQQEFLEKVKACVTEAVKDARSNPKFPASAIPGALTAPVGTPRGGRAGGSAEGRLQRVLDLVDDALSSLDRGDEGEAADILDDILDRYADEDED